MLDLLTFSIDDSTQIGPNVTNFFKLKTYFFCTSRNIFVVCLMIVDIRELIQVDDVMEDPSLRFGPNGGLVFCMEYLANNLDWLEESLGHVEDDYILFDCPGSVLHLMCNIRNDCIRSGIHVTV